MNPVTVVKNLLFSSTNNNRLGGADEVFAAISERSDTGLPDEITFGEPELVDVGGQFSTELRVVIPTSTYRTGGNPADLDYPLPDGIEDAEADFYTLLDYFGIETVADLHELEGNAVPGQWVNGSFVPHFDALEADE